MKTAGEFWANVDVVGDCWIWRGGKARKGYGGVQWEKKQQRAHRVAYLLAKGPIPEGYHIDHLCKNPPCINPVHLEAVTPWENTLRSTNFVAAYARRTHCHKCGLPFSGDNLRFTQGRRRCRHCHNLSTRKRQDFIYLGDSRLQTVSWMARSGAVSLYRTHLHLTVDGISTLCGRTIPQAAQPEQGPGTCGRCLTVLLIA